MINKRIFPKEILSLIPRNAHFFHDKKTFCHIFHSVKQHTNPNNNTSPTNHRNGFSVSDGKFNEIYKNDTLREYASIHDGRGSEKLLPINNVDLYSDDELTKVSSISHDKQLLIAVNNNADTKLGIILLDNVGK